MKTKLIFFLTSLFTINLALAQTLPEEFPLGSLLSDALQPLIEKVGIFLGGVFSL